MKKLVFFAAISALLLTGCLPKPGPATEDDLAIYENGKNLEEIQAECEQMKEYQGSSPECKALERKQMEMEMAKIMLDGALKMIEPKEKETEEERPAQESINKALLFAAKLGDLETLKKMLSMGADVNYGHEVGGMTPLMAAAEGGFVECIKALIDAGADLNCQDRDGITALMRAANAAYLGNIQSVKALIAAGADVNIVTKRGVTAALTASEFDCTGCLGALIAAGADVNVAEKSLGFTPLMYMATAGDVHGIRILVDAGADVNVTIENTGLTPLIAASTGAHQRMDGVLLLLNAGANPNRKLTRNEYRFSEGMDGCDVSRSMASSIPTDEYVENAEKYCSILFWQRAKRLFIF